MKSTSPHSSVVIKLHEGAYGRALVIFTRISSELMMAEEQRSADGIVGSEAQMLLASASLRYRTSASIKYNFHPRVL